MFPVRFIIGLLLPLILQFTAEQSVADNLDQQVTGRVQQYQESLRQRTEKISPAFQAKIEAQTEQTTAEGLEK